MSLDTVQRILELLDLELDIRENRMLPTFDELLDNEGL